MEQTPVELNGARVVEVALIAVEIRATGGTVHRVGNSVLAPAYALAICTYPNETGVYLFYCDREWQVLTDTWHPSLDEAKAQAEFEYAGVSRAWKDAV